MSDRPSLLLLNLFMVHPVDSGSKVLIYNRIVELSKSFRVTFCCLEENETDQAGADVLRAHAEVVLVRGAWRKRGAVARLASLLWEPSATEFAPKLDAWFESEEMRALLERRFDLVEVHSSCWHRRVLRRLAGLRVLVAHNRELDYYRGRTRAAFRLSGPGAGLRAAFDAALVAWQEQRAIDAADAVVSVAPIAPADQEHWFGRRPVLCNWGGVDVERYREPAPRPPNLGDGPTLVFVAAMFVEPAIDGATRFVIEALPEIARAFPDVRVVLVGDHRDRPEVLRLASEHARVEVTGWVEDVRPHLAAADLVVAPILEGSGVRYKLMEAFAAARPVVATEKAAEGLALCHRHDALLAADVRGMAPLVVEALGDEALRRRLAGNALQTARARFDRVAEHARLADWYRDQLAPTAAAAAGVPSQTTSS